MPIISLQVSDELLDRFEKCRNKCGFNSKSEALREAIVNFIENNEKFENLKGFKIFIFNLVYPFKEVIIEQLSELYIQFRQIIKTINDWRIAEKKIETILTVGEFGLIKDLVNKIAGVKEVICSVNEIIID